MVVYNELVALTAGAGLLGFAAFLTYLIRGRRIDSEGWAGFFAVTGVLLLSLGIHTTVTWPFGGNGFEYANIAFGQPAAGFGALLLFAAVYLWRHRALYAGGIEEANATTLSAFKPVGIFVGALGLGMAVLAITFVRFQLGAAPPEEPISGRFGHLPILEALFLGGRGPSSPSAHCCSRSRSGPTVRSSCAGPCGPGSSAAPCSCSSAR